MDICRGQRVPLAQLINNHAQLFHVESSITGVVIDFACFGLDTDSKLLNDDYMVFFNQSQTPCGSIAITAQSNSAVFSCDLNKLPSSVERLVFTAAIDGLQTMNQIQFGCLRFLTDNQETAKFKFHSSDFAQERSLILGEIYRKNGDWRFNAIGQGFNEGLEKLVEYFGSVVAATGDLGFQKIDASDDFIDMTNISGLSAGVIGSAENFADNVILNAIRGHGFAAEKANHLHDVFTGNDVATLNRTLFYKITEKT